MLTRIAVSVALCAALAACGAESIYAPDEAVRAATFVSGEPPSITLYTVISNRSNGGAHTGLLIDGSQRVMFDPAGSWTHPELPERNDVFFGVTDRMVNYYIDYHARETFRMVEQKVYVSPQVAQLVMQRAMAYGAVPQAQCSNSTSRILSGVPGFESLGNTWFPLKLSERFAELPGVTTRVILDEDADDNHGVLLRQAADEPPPE
jgi:hypothetical protein